VEILGHRFRVVLVRFLCLSPQKANDMPNRSAVGRVLSLALASGECEEKKNSR
jgi:hypothetical protein